MANVVCSEVERSPELKRSVGIEEVGRHHADDFVSLPVELDLATDDGGVASEAPGPELMTENDYLRIGELFFLGEYAPECGRCAEDAT